MRVMTAARMMRPVLPGSISNGIEMLRFILNRRCLAFGLCAFMGCADGDSTSKASEPAPLQFANPRRVALRGYDDHAMEPALSRDGRYLFFNNSNDPSVNTNLHWAERLDDLTFEYRGEIDGVNTAALEGVPSMDLRNVFYFVSTRSYDQTASTLFRGSFSNGAVSGVELVRGVSAEAPGQVNFDAEISPDGDALYFVDSRFGSSGPLTADIKVALRTGAIFERAKSDLLQKINTDALEYAPAVSASGLEIFFTRAESDTPAIYAAWRASASDPFGSPEKITAATGFVEAPSLSADEKSLYYHKKEAGIFVLYRLSRE
jgi:Tol biopolymer transport system component